MGIMLVVVQEVGIGGMLGRWMMPRCSPSRPCWGILMSLSYQPILWCGNTI